MTTCAAIDIGSNAIRCVVGYLNEDGKLNQIANSREPIRLGADVFDDHILKETTIEKASLAIKTLQEFAKSKGAEKIRAVATSATREAHNGQDLINRVKKDSNIDIDIINGVEEARLIHLAVNNALSLKDELSLLLDIGGGSVEITLVKKDEILFTESVPLGAVRLLSLMQRTSNAEKIIKRFITQTSQELLTQVKDNIKAEKITTIIATGGNLEALGELGVRLNLSESKDKLSAESLDKIIELLQKYSLEERTQKLGLKEDRRDVIYPASIVVKHVVSTLNLKDILIPNVGLKDGVLIDLFQHEKGFGEIDHKTLYSFILKLGKKYKLNQQHAKKVQSIALQFFDSLENLHKLDKNKRFILEVASYLHDIGQFISGKGHHKHSCSIILATAFPEISEETKIVIASIARYHRKSLPTDKHSPYKNLSQENKLVVNKLASILRLADALDRSHEDKVKKINLEIKERTIQVSLEPKTEDLSLESWAFEKKKDYFEKIYDRKIAVKE